MQDAGRPEPASEAVDERRHDHSGAGGGECIISVSPLAKLVLAGLWVYKKCVSPWMPPCCRFTPTCGSYAVEAVAKHGAVKGSALALWRLLRCQPFCKGGYDPVPEPSPKASKR